MTMRATYIGDLEDSLLQGLPWQTQLLYIRVLRKFMDDSNGFAGMPGGVPITLLRISEALFIEPAKGRNGAGAPDRHTVSRALKQLEKAGLAVRKMDNAFGGMVFFLPVAFHTLQKVRGEYTDEDVIRELPELIPSLDDFPEELQEPEWEPEVPVKAVVETEEMFPVFESLPVSNSEAFYGRFEGKKGSTKWKKTSAEKAVAQNASDCKLAPKSRQGSAEVAPGESAAKCVNIGEIFRSSKDSMNRMNFSVFGKVARHISDIRDLNLDINYKARAREQQEEAKRRDEWRSDTGKTAAEASAHVARLIEQHHAEMAEHTRQKQAEKDEFNRKLREMWEEDQILLAELESRPIIPTTGGIAAIMKNWVAPDA